MFTQLINTLLPPVCIHCYREGSWLCSTARAQLAPEEVLHNPLPIAGIDVVLCRGSYDNAIIASLVQAVKYRFWHGARDVFSETLRPLATALPALPTSELVPVPLHPRRLRERGFNQSLLIAQALERLTAIPVRERLRRERYTTPQAQLRAIERRKNMIGAIDSHDEDPWPNTIILVDDVITTGSTVAECAKIARQHGVAQIVAVAIAKG